MPTGAGARHAFLDWPGPIAFAHRGGALEQPENTIRAFEAGIALGYRYFETDIRMTADGVPALFHDDDLARTTGRPGPLAGLPWSEARHLRIDGRDPIARLDDVLGSWPDLRWNIDVKEEAAIGAVVGSVERTSSAGRVCLASFSQHRITALRRALGPEVCTAMSRPEVVRWVVGSTLGLRAFVPDVPAAQVPRRNGRLAVVTRRTLDGAHQRGIQVHVWTVDEAAEMDELLDLGVDGLMTDRPSVLKQVLQRRGQWVD